MCRPLQAARVRASHAPTPASGLTWRALSSFDHGSISTRAAAAPLNARGQWQRTTSGNTYFHGAATVGQTRSFGFFGLGGNTSPPQDSGDDSVAVDSAVATNGDAGAQVAPPSITDMVNERLAAVDSTWAEATVSAASSASGTVFMMEPWLSCLAYT